VEGRLGVTASGERVVYRPGDVVELAAGVRSTLWNAGVGTVRLADDYSPPLRRAQWIETTLPVRTAPPSRRRLLSSIAVVGAIVAVVGAVLGARSRRRR
jgi:hypothetical protein